MLCLVDLSKCFDVIDHELLIGKLETHGIETSWFTAYLQGHTQSISLKNGPGCRELSRPLPNAMSVFQGSVLGPLPFTDLKTSYHCILWDLDLYVDSYTAFLQNLNTLGKSSAHPFS